jgi:hypothetical protein
MKRQPIETAPRDGTDVIVFWADETEQDYAAVAWFRRWDDVKDIGGDWTRDDEGWWTYVSSVSQVKIEPAHWVPFPEPPDA